MPSKNDDLKKFIQEVAADKRAKKAKSADRPIISAEQRKLAEEDPRARAKRANATSGMKHGGKVKTRQKLRGCGIAKKGTRKAKMR